MKKRLLSILMVTAMCATMAVGCGTADDTKDSSSSSKGKSDYLVGFANNSDTYNYCAKFRSYLKDATEAKGISITVTDAGGDTNVQNGQIDDFIVQNAKVVFEIKVSQFAFLDEEMKWKVEKGEIELLAGSSCEDIRLSDIVSISEDDYIDGKTRGFYAKAVVC